MRYLLIRSSIICCYRCYGEPLLTSYKALENVNLCVCDVLTSVTSTPSCGSRSRRRPAVAAGDGCEHGDHERGRRDGARRRPTLRPAGRRQAAGRGRRYCRIDVTWFNLIWLDLTWSDSIWLDPTRFDSIRLDSTRFDSIRLDSTRFDSIRLDSTRLDSIRLDSTRFDSIRLDSIWFNLIWLDLTWFDLIWLDLTLFNFI